MNNATVIVSKCGSTCCRMSSPSLASVQVGSSDHEPVSQQSVALFTGNSHSVALLTGNARVVAVTNILNHVHIKTYIISYLFYIRHCYSDEIIGNVSCKNERMNRYIPD